MVARGSISLAAFPKPCRRLDVARCGRCSGQIWRSYLSICSRGFRILCATGGDPVSWSKTQGVDTIACAGCVLLLRNGRLGKSQRRTEWFTRWTSGAARASTVRIGSSQEGLGRIMWLARRSMSGLHEGCSTDVPLSANLRLTHPSSSTFSGDRSPNANTSIARLRLSLRRYHPASTHKRAVKGQVLEDVSPHWTGTVISHDI